MYFKILIFFFLPLYLYSNEKVDNINIGYHNNIDLVPKYKNSQSALNIWIKDFTKNIYEDTNMSLYLNKQDMIDDYNINKLDIIPITAYEYLNNKNKLDNNTIDYYHLRKSKNNSFQKMYLIVNKKSNINSILDLKDKKIGINLRNTFGKIFLEKTYLKKAKKNADEIISKINYNKSNSLLLQTYFSKYDAAIISSYEYDVMLELNPTIKNKIKILEESPQIFPYILILFNKNTASKNKSILKNLLDQFLINKKKKELYEIIKVKKLAKIEKKDLDILNIYYQRYLKLKKKYK